MTQAVADCWPGGWRWARRLTRCWPGRGGTNEAECGLSTGFQFHREAEASKILTRSFTEEAHGVSRSSGDLNDFLAMFVVLLIPGGGNTDVPSHDVSGEESTFPPPGITCFPCNSVCFLRGTPC